MNEKKKNKIQKMVAQIDQIVEEARQMENQNRDLLLRVHPRFSQSARNLIHYRALRQYDLRDIQKRLGNMGLSRLAKAQSHVMSSLLAVRSILVALLEENPVHLRRGDFSIKKGNRFLKSNAKSLLGYRSKGRRTRIMVTLPGEAADDFQLVYEMVGAGMNCARINCAHDNAGIWERMIGHVRDASRKLKRHCQITMDLGGPKIRTGPVQPGPQVVKFTPERDIRGKVIHPVRLWLSPEPHPDSDAEHLPVALEDLHGLQPGDRLFFTDTRDKKRELIVTAANEEGCWAICFDSAYVETGTAIYRDASYTAPPFFVGLVPSIEQYLLLQTGDTLRLHRTPDPGEPARYDESGKLLAEAHISCTADEIFEQTKPGEPILFDDGKIEGIIRHVSPEELLIEISYAKYGGAKLRADKGINLPASDLKIRGLTEKDRRDLEFIARHADVVNMSFVHSAQDVRDLIAEIDRLNARDRLGIILKIETQNGFDNLTGILLEAMQVYPVGVMIARGDLAIECGWENIGRIQEEILSLCLAAHIPDIWATQVLENLAKKGIPSRAEITDAAMAQRADCVMLNKGPYIIRAIQLLDTILKEREPYQEKNAPLTPAMGR